MNGHQTLLALIQDARGAYTLTTPQLEQALAASVGATHGRKSDEPIVRTVEATRRTISAVLQARRRVDADEARQQAEAPTRAPSAPTAGGQRVPRVPPPPPTRPNADARQPAMDLL